MTEITSCHAHVYFNETSVDKARAICGRARELSGVGTGPVREGPVGPHLCRLASGPELSAGVMPWLALNRDGLVVFCHPETGDVIADHTRHAIWMGAGMDPTSLRSAADGPAGSGNRESENRVAPRHEARVRFRSNSTGCPIRC